MLAHLEDFRRQQTEAAPEEGQQLARTRACLTAIGMHIGRLAAVRGAAISAPLWDHVSKFTANKLAGDKLEWLYNTMVKGQAAAAAGAVGTPPSAGLASSSGGSAAVPAAAAPLQAAVPGMAVPLGWQPHVPHPAAMAMAPGAAAMMAPGAMASAMAALKNLANQQMFMQSVAAMQAAPQAPAAPVPVAPVAAPTVAAPAQPAPPPAGPAAEQPTGGANGAQNA